MVHLELWSESPRARASNHGGAWKSSIKLLGFNIIHQLVDTHLCYGYLLVAAALCFLRQLGLICLYTVYVLCRLCYGCQKLLPENTVSVCLVLTLVLFCWLVAFDSLINYIYVCIICTFFIKKARLIFAIPLTLCQINFLTFGIQ